MAKFFGKVGYVKTEETTPGVWTEQVTEREYYGDVNRRHGKWETASDKINDDITISVEISIVADAYAYENLGYIRYVEYMGCKWKVSNIDPQYPRITLSFRGIYNGEEAATSE